MVGVCDEKGERAEDFSRHIALHQGCESFHERWEDITGKGLGLESI